MTEDIAIRSLEKFPIWNRSDKWLSPDGMEELVAICIKAIEENQQYRLIGTMKQLKDMKQTYVEALSDWIGGEKMGSAEVEKLIEMTRAMTYAEQQEIVKGLPTQLIYEELGSRLALQAGFIGDIVTTVKSAT